MWLIEQWITGAPLSAVLAVTKKLRAIDALALIHGALQGLSYAHGRDVVHGDITPANILIDQSGTPMLVDFGLAVSPGSPQPGRHPGLHGARGCRGPTRRQALRCVQQLCRVGRTAQGARLFTQCEQPGADS